MSGSLETNQTNDNSGYAWWVEEGAFLPVLPEARADSYDTIAANLVSQLSLMDLSGETDVVTSEWDMWRLSRHIYPVIPEAEPKKFTRMTFNELAERGKGWKFHLNVDTEDAHKVKKMSDFLNALHNHNAITTYKIGSGGGKAYGQPGKEVTVYIGHRNKANIVAPVIEAVMADTLDMPGLDALKDDITFTKHVIGRFEVANTDFEFHQYGAKGHPLLNADIEVLGTSQHETASEKALRKAEATTRAYNMLVRRYGQFYTGSVT